MPKTSMGLVWWVSQRKIISFNFGVFFFFLYIQISSRHSHLIRIRVSRWLVCDEGGAKFIRFGINLVVSSRRGKEGFTKRRSFIPSCPPPCCPFLCSRRPSPSRRPPSSPLPPFSPHRPLSSRSPPPWAGPASGCAGSAPSSRPSPPPSGRPRRGPPC